MSGGWTDERVARLKKDWNDRLSALAIANRLGCGITRAAVCGKVRRLGLPYREGPMASAAERARSKRKTPRKPYKIGVKSNAQIAHERAQAQAHYAAVRALPEIAIPPSERQTLLIRGEDGRLHENTAFSNRHCHWPLDSRSAAGMMEYCGRQAVPGAAYCLHHFARLQVPVQPRRRQLGMPASTTPLAETGERVEKGAQPVREKESA